MAAASGVSAKAALQASAETQAFVGRPRGKRFHLADAGLALLLDPDLDVPPAHGGGLDRDGARPERPGEAGRNEEREEDPDEASDHLIPSS